MILCTETSFPGTHSVKLVVAVFRDQIKGRKQTLTFAKRYKSSLFLS